MTFDEFLALYSQRLNSYVFRYRKQFRLPIHLQEDLRQGAQIAVWRQIGSWRAYEGGRSPFNWVAPHIRRAMEEIMRRHYGLKIRSAQSLPLQSLEYDDSMVRDETYKAAEETLDLRRILTADKKPAHVVRFIATALSPASGADIARKYGISRQAVCMSVSQTRKRLRLAMG